MLKDKLFKVNTEDGSVVFVGNKLEIFVPRRYESHGCLTVSDTIKLLAVFDMVLDDTVHLGYYLPSIIVTQPSSNEIINDDGTAFLKFTYYKNDIFMKNHELVKQSFLGYVIFYEFIYLGVRPNFMGYEYVSSIFDDIKEIADVKIPANRVVFEMIASHLHRNTDNVKEYYRYTDMTQPPTVIPLSDVSHAAISTTARIVGSYFNQAVDSSLVNASDVNSKLEDMLRL
jgi:hypothetical protein